MTIKRKIRAALRRWQPARGLAAIGPRTTIDRRAIIKGRETVMSRATVLGSPVGRGLTG